jgi:hypothetical protein
MGDSFSAGLRIATGENSSPVSPNQSLGLANQQGGQFSKYAICDRAFLKWEAGVQPSKYSRSPRALRQSIFLHRDHV